MAYQLPPTITARGPIGAGAYTIQDGDCIDSITYSTGHVWRTIWGHPANAVLRTSRVSHNLLLPGDQLFIPSKTLKEISRPVDARHKFVRKGTPAKLRVQLLEAGMPRANQSYRLVIDGDVHTGTTDSDGWIEVAIPPTAQTGELTVGNNPLRPPYQLVLGGMDPITEPSGIQKRLRNLGFPCEVTSELDDATRAALAMFQKGEDLDATGDPDHDTLDKLKKRYGS